MATKAKKVKAKKTVKKVAKKAVKIVKKKTTTKAKKTSRKKKVVKNLFDPENNFLVPNHTKLSETAKKQLFTKYSISIKELPKIDRKDPAIAKLDFIVGDVVKIERETPGVGKTIYYRGVIDVK